MYVHVSRNSPFQTLSLEHNYHLIQRYKQEKYNTRALKRKNSIKLIYSTFMYTVHLNLKGINNNITLA